MHLFHRCAALALAALLAASSLLPQTLMYGSLTGTITDSAGAVVPNVELTLTHLGTQDRRTVVTDANGAYQFLNLAPADYRLEAVLTGFKRLRREPVTIEVNRAVRIDAAMELGAVSESVDVTAATPLLDPQTSSLGQTVDTRKVRDLPLNGRNPLALVALVPAVIPQAGSQRAPAGQNFFAWGNFQIGGGSTNQSQAFLDGAPLNLSYYNLLALVPTQDSISEFKVQTNSSSAEFGRTAGGIINMVTRSGTNAFHGTVYEFLRNEKLNANTFFNNRAGVGRPHFVQNQYGATATGPIRRDRLFFMANWEGYRQRVARSLVASVPTAAMREGDFSNLRDARGALTPVYDPATTCGQFGNPGCATDAAGSPSVTRSPFPGNVIPASRLSRAARVLANTWALPNTPGEPFTNVNNWAGNASGGADADWLNGRADWNLNERHRLFGRYSLWKSLTGEIDPFGTGFYPTNLVQGSPEDFTTQQAIVAHTFAIRPTTIFEVRVSFLRQRYDRASGSAGYDLTQLGWPSFMNDQVTARFLPALNVVGLTGSSRNTGSLIVGRTDDRTVGSSLTQVSGGHTIKFGGEMRIGPFNYLQLSAGSGSFNFDRVFTSSNPFSPVGGFGFASFMLGLPNGGDIPTSQYVSGQQIYRALYAQDDWRVSRRVTLNLGLRYDQAGPWSERYDRLSVFLPDEASPLAARVGLPLRGRLAVVNSDEVPSRNPVRLNKNMFAPRVGLAVQLNPSTVLRTAYGLFWIPNQVAFSAHPNNDPVNSQGNTFVGTIDGGVTPFNTLANPFPQGLIQPPGRDPRFEELQWGLSPQTSVQDTPYGYTQQWNLNLQRELPLGFFADAAYAGAKGTHLPFGGVQINQLPDQYLSLGQALFRQVPNPFFNIVRQGSLQSATVSAGQLLRPYPQFAGLQLAALGIGNSSYHSFQLKVQRRFAQGASLLLAYTASKLITDGIDSLTGHLETEAGGVPAVQNWNNLRAERSLSGFDASQRLVLSYTLDLPVGRGRRLGGNAPGWVNRLIAGWTLEGITTLQTGSPLRLTANPNNTGSFGGGSRPNSTGRSAELEGPAQSRLGRWFDTSAFTQPAPFTFGNVARTLPDVRSHGVANWDLGVVKNTTLGGGDRLGLQFRAEVFNLMNRVQFGYPGQTLGTPQFGVISSQVNDPRLVQLALRLQW